ncbi:MAG: DEAD/DEAH box helicase family protein [Clostridiales bacterium]|nr:DEAD/DEAH box helicase family protein [Clostridiales bacterium]
MREVGENEITRNRRDDNAGDSLATERIAEYRAVYETAAAFYAKYQGASGFAKIGEMYAEAERITAENGHTFLKTLMESAVKQVQQSQTNISLAESDLQAAYGKAFAFHEKYAARKITPSDWRELAFAFGAIVKQNPENTLIKELLNTAIDDIERIYTSVPVQIEQADVDALREIEPRKSVLNFSNEETEKTAKFEEKFSRELLQKSPYERRLEDWREAEETATPILSIENRGVDFKSAYADIKNHTIKRGIVSNKDTNWQINITRKGLDDTYKYADRYERRDKGKSAYSRLNALYQLDKILADCVFLDTRVSELSGKNKADTTLFMHHGYSVVKYDNEPLLFDVAIEEYQVPGGDTNKRLYNLKHIKIIPLERVGLAENGYTREQFNDITEISVAQLFIFVKTFDKKFYLNTPDRADREAEFATERRQPEQMALDLTPSLPSLDSGVPTAPENPARTDLASRPQSAQPKRHEPAASAPNLYQPEPDERSARTEAVDPAPSTPAADGRVPPPNYRITDPALGSYGAKTRYTNNLAAIRTLKQLEAENRPAAPDEQEILSKYTGWGAIQQAFDPRKEDWRDEYAELKENLTYDEYASARATVNNAHYTSPLVISAIYKTVENMGFSGGRILEPSCGVGNFLGVMPPEISENSRIYGVELDSVTGRIARFLYPQANIAVKGFEQTNFPDNHFDLAVGNVPFGSYKVIDRDYDHLDFLIHDYFFSKAIDKVRPGGIIAFVTSKGTLDKKDSRARQYMAERAELVGAIRLPNTAFRANAGTEVTTDLIFLQKRAEPLQVSPDWVVVGQTDDGIPINQYFLDHPEMILGRMEFSKNMYGNEKETACVPFENSDLSEQLNATVSKIRAEFTAQNTEQLDETEETELPAPLSARNFTYVIKDGKPYFVSDGRLEKADIKGKTLDRLAGLINVRETAVNLVAAQSRGCDDEELLSLQQKLNQVYDGFTAVYGNLTSDTNKRIFAEDDYANLLCALEHTDAETKQLAKADIFMKRTILSNAETTRTDTAEEALTVSLDKRGRVDLAYMSNLCGTEIEQIMKELEYKNLIYLNPETNKHEEASEYLSGNVREKLKIAELAAKENDAFARNSEALQAVLPLFLEAADISAKIGVPWIDIDDYALFLRECTNAKLQPGQLRRTLVGEYKISGKFLDGSVAATSTHGTSRMTSYAIFENLLNQRDMIVRDSVKQPDGSVKYVLNRKETELAIEKSKQMSSAFAQWIWQNAERRDKYEKRYNEMFNCLVGRKYDGSHQTFPGMSAFIELKPHQKDAIAMAKYGGNTLLAHAVGAGKSFEFIAAIMEKKRLGLISKAVVIVPKTLVGQTAAEWQRLYPNARILSAAEGDFDKQNRRRFTARCATGDYDGVIMSYEQFEKISMSPEYQRQFLRNEIDLITGAIEELDKDDRRSVKDLESLRKKAMKRLDKLFHGGKTKDTSLSFEEIGFDYVVTDEAHNYKNGMILSKMRNVAGVTNRPAQKSEDMLMKTSYLNDKYGEKNILYATGTPVSNSMTELYTMTKYLRPDLLEQAGLRIFDDWAATFGEVVTQMEMKPAGNGFRPKKRFARFVNIPELIMTYKQFADVKNAEDLPLKIPKFFGGKPQTVLAKINDSQRDYMAVLAARAERIANGQVKPWEDNMLAVTHSARLLGLDARAIDPLVAASRQRPGGQVGPSAPNFPDSKVNMCVDNLMNIYEETAEQKGVQAVFCDIAIHADNGRFSVYEYIKAELVERGVPEAEICFAGDVKTDERRQQMFADLRNGGKRIVIASTSKMGTGANFQTRLAAVHHLDVPWRPSDLEQRNGRILRQGNDFSEVKIFNYLTEGTFDAYLMNIITTKQRFISQLMSGKTSERTCGDVDEFVLTYVEMQAVSSGNPQVKRFIELESELSRLELLEREHSRKIFDLRDVIERGKTTIAKYERRLENLKADSEQAAKIGDNFSIKIGDKVFAERKDAGEELEKFLAAAQIGMPPKIVGEYGGFGMYLEKTTRLSEIYHKITLRGKDSYETSVDRANALGNIRRIENLLGNIPANIPAAEQKLAETIVDLKEAERNVGAPFEHAAELSALREEFTKLGAELGGKLSQPDAPVIAADDDSEDAPDEPPQSPQKENRAEEIDSPVPEKHKSQKGITH